MAYIHLTQNDLLMLKLTKSCWLWSYKLKFVISLNWIFSIYCWNSVFFKYAEQLAQMSPSKAKTRFTTVNYWKATYPTEILLVTSWRAGEGTDMVTDTNWWIECSAGSARLHTTRFRGVLCEVLIESATVSIRGIHPSSITYAVIS